VRTRPALHEDVEAKADAMRPRPKILDLTSLKCINAIAADC